MLHHLRIAPSWYFTSFSFSGRYFNTSRRSGWVTFKFFKKHALLLENEISDHNEAPEDASPTTPCRRGKTREWGGRELRKFVCGLPEVWHCQGPTQLLQLLQEGLIPTWLLPLIRKKRLDLTPLFSELLPAMLRIAHQSFEVTIAGGKVLI